MAAPPAAMEPALLGAPASSSPAALSCPKAPPPQPTRPKQTKAPAVRMRKLLGALEPPPASSLQARSIGARVQGPHCRRLGRQRDSNAALSAARAIAPTGRAAP